MTKIAGGKVPSPSYKRSAFDYYPTPAVATNILLEKVVFEGPILEPASGSGDISKVLEQAGFKVESSDLQTSDMVYGKKGLDFLKREDRFESLITNPPYVLAEEFILQSLRLFNKKCAFLVRIAFLESARRFKIFTDNPPHKVIIISKRLPFYANNRWIRQGAVFGHCWVVFEKGFQGPTQLEWSTFCPEILDK
jgi:hypothetical protein